MADRQGRIEIEAVVDNQLQAALSSMGSSIRSVLQVTQSLSANNLNNTNTSAALVKALGSATSASATYAKSTHNLARNQAVLAKHFKDVKIAASQLDTQMRSNTQSTTQEKAAIDRLTTSLRAQEAARKGVMQYSMQTDLRRQSDALNQLANRYSMSGNRMSMALTLPITSFMRSSFANYRRVEVETVRTTKLISDSYAKAADVAGFAGAKLSADNLSYTRSVNGVTKTLLTLEGANKSLGKQLDAISLKYGVARELVQGLAGDFAELGIENVDTLAGLAGLTTEVEKLGNLDIGDSQEFIKSIFQTIMRVKRDQGALKQTSDGMIVYGDVIAEVTQQLALFNLIENKTQLSLKDTQKAFPELTAAATSFGLSMTEAMALVVPMVSAGFQVGASANSVKVSLQRIVDLTKENSQMIDTLRSSYSGFNVEAGVSIKTIQALADSYNSMKGGKLGEQGTLQFFSSLFGVRQGPRMEVAIQNAAQFQDQLDKLGTVENTLLKKLEENVQQQAKFAGLGQEFTDMKVKNFADMGEVVRLSQEVDPVTKKITDQAKAFYEARRQLGIYVRDQAKLGNDVLSKITTEYGKASFIGAIGDAEAQRKYKEEVEASLQTVENRYQRGREAIKAIGRQIVPILGQVLEAVLPILLKINEAFEKMPSWMKAFIGLGLLILAAIGPVMKLVGGMIQMKSAMLGIKAGGGFFGGLRKQTKEISAEMLLASDAATRFKSRLTEVGGKFYLQATKKEIKDLEKLMQLQAAGGSKRKIAGLEKRLGITGKASDLSGLSPQAQDDILRARGGGQLSDQERNLAGYRQDSFTKAGFPAKVMTPAAAGQQMGEAFLAVLKLYKFDASAVKAASQAATASATSASSVVNAANLPRKGTPPAPPAPPAPPTPPAPPSGGGGSPSGGGRPVIPTGGGAPSGASATPTAPTNSNPMPVTVVGAPAHGPLPTTVPVNLRRTTLPMIDPDIVNPNNAIPASMIPAPKVPAFQESSNRIPASLLDRSIPAATTSAVKEVVNASKESLSAMAIGIKKAPVESLRILAKNLDIVKATVNGQVKPISQIGVKALRSILLDYMKGIKDGLVFGKDVAAEKKKKADVKAQGANAPPSDKGSTSAVEKTSDTGAKNAQVAQGKKNKAAVDTQVNADIKAINEIKEAPGAKLSGIPARAKAFSSSIYQMMMNAGISMNKPADEIFNSLQLVKKSADDFYFPKAKFLQLAQTLGIQLPSVFNLMGELTNEGGKEIVAQQKKSILKLIESMTKTVNVTKKSAIGKAFPELVGQKVLQFEAEVNRALMTGAGSRQRFNFKGLGDRLSKSFSKAFTTTAGGDIFSTLTSKVGSKSGAQAGAVDYTKLTFKDLGYNFKASKGGSKVTDAKVADDIRAVDGNTAKWARELLGMSDDGLRLSRELVLNTRRQLKALLQYVPDSRAKSAVIRQEMTTTAGYKELTSRKMTTPGTEEGKARKMAKSPVDLMSEGDYAEFNKVRQAGINAAKKLSEQRKNLFKTIAKDVKIPVEIIDQMLTVMSQNDGKLGTLKGVAADTKKVMRDSFKTLEATLKKAGITVNEALVQPALATSLIAANQKVLAGSGGMRLTNDQAADLAGNRDNTLKPIVNPQGNVDKIDKGKRKATTYNFEKQLQDRLDAREKELKALGGEIKPGVRTSGIKAAIQQVSKELTKVATDQIAGILRDIENVKATTIKPQDQLQKAKDKIAKINTFKGADLKSEEAKEILGGKTKKAYIEEQQSIVNTAQLAINAAKTEIELRELKIKAIEKEVEAQRKLLAEKAKELLPKTKVSLATGSVRPFAASEAAEPRGGKTGSFKPIGVQVDADKRAPDAVSTAVVKEATAVSKDVAKAEEAVRIARERLNDLKGLKTDISMAEPGKEFAASAQKRVDEAIRKLKIKVDNLNVEIEKQEIAVNKAQSELNAVYQARNAGGGGRVGGTSMRNDPFMMDMGMPVRGPKMPNLAGPTVAFMDTGAITGGVNTLYGEIQTALKIPSDVMAQVIENLKVKHNVITAVGTTSVTKLQGDIGKLIEALRELLQGTDLTVENVQKALVQKRAMIGKFGSSSGSKASASSSEQIGLPKVTKPRSGSTPEYDTYVSERNALVAQIKAEIANSGTNQVQLLRIHEDTLRQLARSYGVEASIVNSGSKTKMANAILALQQVTKNEEAFFSNNLRTVQQAAAAVKTVRPARIPTPAVIPVPTPAVAFSNDYLAQVKSGVRMSDQSREFLTRSSPNPAVRDSGVPVSVRMPTARSVAPSVAVPPAPAVPMPRNMGAELQARLQNQLARTYEKRKAIEEARLAFEERVNAQLQRSAQKRAQILVDQRKAFADQYLAMKPTVGGIVNAMKPTLPRFKQDIYSGMEAVNLRAIGRSMAEDLMIFGREVKAGGSVVKTMLSKGFKDIRDAFSTAPDPSRTGRLVRGFLNPLRMVEGGLSGFGKTLNTVFAPSRIEYLARALGGTAPLMKYRKTDPLTGQAMPPIEGFVNNLKATLPRALMGVGKVIQNSNMFPNLQALLQQTYGAYMPTKLSMGAGRGGRTPVTESGQRKTGMGGILDANLRRAGVPTTRQTTAQAQNLSAQLFANITPSGFETGLTSIVQKVSGFTNRLLVGSQRINSAIESTGRAIGTALMVGAKVTTFASVAAVPTMVRGYKAIGSATVTGISGLIGNINSALGIVDKMAQNTGNKKVENFAKNLRKGAVRGAQVGSLQKDASLIDLANLTVKQKLGALAGIITVAGTQFGTSSLKFTAQVGLAMTQLTLKLVPFGGTIMKVGSAVGKVGSGMLNTGKAMKTASSGADTLTGKIMAMGRAASKAAVGAVGKTAGGVKTMIFGAPVGPAGQPAKKGLVGGIMGGAKGMMGGMKGGVVGGMGSAVSMLSYQFGTLGMIAGPILASLISQIASIPKVGGPIIIFLMIVIGIFLLLKKTTSAWSQYSNGAIEKFKQAWVKVKEIFMVILGPVMDFFASFLGGSKDGERSAKDLGEGIGKFADKILEILPKIKSFVEKYVVPVIRQILSGWKLVISAIVPLVKAVIDFVKMIVRLFKGDFKGALDAGKSMIGNLKDAVIKVLKGILVAFAPVVKIIITILAAAVTLIINILEQIPIFFINAIRWMLKTFVQLIFSGMLQPIIFVVDAILTVIATLIQWMIAAVKLIAKAYINAWFSILKGFIFIIDKILEGIGALIRGLGGALGWIPGIGGKIKDAANSIGDSLGRSMDVWAERAQSAQNTVLDVVDTLANGASNLVGRLKDVGNGLGNMAQSAQNALMTGIDNIANWLTGKIGSASDFVAAGRNAINSFIDGMVKDNLIAKGIGDQLTEDLGQAFKDSPAAKAAGEAIKKAISEAMSSLETAYFDAVIGNIGNAMSKIKEELSEILNKQKDDALKAYDDQISAIEALAEAEARLTATEEYESNRRQRIKDRELQKNNYQKERSLAIYEGRIDDARNLDLQELKNTDEFNKEISDMDSSRKKELQGQNRSDAITIIRNNKEEASKLFDEAIKEFEDYVEEVTRNGTISQEQLTEQFTKIAAKAGEKSTAINDAFKASFSALPGLIQTGLDPTTGEAGFFSMEMDKLVNVAKTKFGLDTANSGDTSSILGVTTAMLTSTSQGIPSVISTAFSTGGIIQTTYGSAMSQLSAYIAAKQDPNDPNSLAAVYKKAITDANTAMEQEALKAQRGIGSAFAAIVATINEKVKALTIAEAVKKGLAEAKAAAASGAADIGNAISTGGTGNPPAGGSATEMKYNGTNTAAFGKFWSVDTVVAGMNTFWYKALTRGAKWKKATPEWLQTNWGKVATGIFKFAATTGAVPTFFKGGKMSYANGGPTFGPMHQGIPTMLHGGEFVLRKASVDKYGLDMLNQMNKGIYMPNVPKFNIPMSSYAKIANAGTQPQVSKSESTHNYNFYVDNFIGETEWFNSMMKDYNMKVVPANQKQAGLESRVIKTYNGINRGL